MPRIVEALQSNVWTGMEFSTDNRPSLMAAAAAVPGVSRGGGGRNAGVVGSVSGSSSAGEAGTAELSPSVGDGEQEVVSSLCASACWVPESFRVVAAVASVARVSLLRGVDWSAPLECWVLYLRCPCLLPFARVVALGT